MMSVDQMVNTVKDYFTLKDIFDNSYDATSATLSGSELGQACDAYAQNPSLETAEAVRQANRNFYEKVWQWVQDFFPEYANDTTKDSLNKARDSFFDSEDATGREIDLLNEREARLKREKFSSPEISADCKPFADAAKVSPKLSIAFVMFFIGHQRAASI